MKTFKRNNKFLAFTFFILLLNTACDKEAGYEALSGQLIGYVTLYNNDRIKESDNSGVEIIFEGSNPQIEVSTNEDGQFIIDNLKSGIYNIIFNKEGYCQHQINSFQFVGGNKPATTNQTYLYSQPNLQIDSLKITIESQYVVQYRATAKVSDQSENSSSYCRYYLNDKADISSKNYISTDVYYWYSNTDISIYLRIDTLKYPIGSELYMIMYPASETNQYYTDINTGNKIYTSININNPSEVASITIPEVEAP